MLLRGRRDAQPGQGVSLNAFLDRFAPKIYVEVSPESFVFRKNEACFQLQTYVFVAAEGAGFRLVSAGEEPTAYGDALKIALFDNHQRLPAGITKPELLEGFMRYAFKRLTTKTALLRPVVIYRGVNRLEHLFCGYQQALFRELAAAGGAVVVLFDG